MDVRNVKIETGSEVIIRTGEHAGQRGRILGRWTTPAAWVQLPSGEKVVVAAGTLEPADAGGEEA